MNQETNLYRGEYISQEVSSDMINRMKDPKFYLESFCKIKTPHNGGGIRPFILNDVQKDLFNTIRRNNRIMVLKARQLGCSTAVAGYAYHYAITHRGVTVALIGYNSDLTKEFLDKVKTFYLTTPEEIRPTVEYNSKYEMTFPKQGSKIRVFPSTEEVGRGFTLDLVLASELAFWDNASTKMTAIEAAAHKGTIIVESCVTGDTVVFTDNGPQRVGKIHDWHNHDLGFSKGKEIYLDGHYGLQPTNLYYNSGERDGFRIETRSGTSLGMSSVHKTFVLRNTLEMEFVEAKDLKVGDFVPLKYGQEAWGSNEIISWRPTPYPGYNKQRIKLFRPEMVTDDLAYLVGLILGDGYVDFKQGRVVVTTMDDEIRDFLLGNSLGLRFLQSTSSDKWHYICKNQSFVEFLSGYIGWEKRKAKEKYVPEVIFSWKKEHVMSFLSGLFDTDGFCDSVRGRIALTSTSESIIDDVKILLLNAGILTRKSEMDVHPTERVKVWSHVFNLEIMPFFVRKFGEDVGFRIKRKQDNICKAIGNDSRCIMIPYIGDFIEKHRKELGFSLKSIGYHDKTKGSMRRETVLKVLNACKNTGSNAYETIANLLRDGYFFDSIKEITPIRENVYDFTVENGHTVTYNGIVGHQTPNGAHGLYYQMWNADNGYEKKKYGWWWLYTEEEIKLIEKRMNNPRKFAQEYSMEFLASGRTVFDPEMIMKAKGGILRLGDKNDKGQTVQTYDGLRVYREPEVDEPYVIGVDVSEGVEGGDYSVVTIFNRRSGEEVAFWKGFIPPDRLATKLSIWGRYFKDALCVVEVNGHGLTTITGLKNALYPNMYFRPAKFESLGFGLSDKMGWRTTKLTRPLMIDDLAQGLRDGMLTIHSEETLDEMLSFIYDDAGNMVTSEGSHDDCLFSTAIAFQGFKAMSGTPLDQVDYSSHLPSSYSY